MNTIRNGEEMLVYEETKRRRKQRIKDKRIAARRFWQNLRQRIEGKGNENP